MCCVREFLWPACIWWHVGSNTLPSRPALVCTLCLPCCFAAFCSAVLALVRRGSDCCCVRRSLPGSDASATDAAPCCHNAGPDLRSRRLGTPRPWRRQLNLLKVVALALAAAPRQRNDPATCAAISSACRSLVPFAFSILTCALLKAVGVAESTEVPVPPQAEPPVAAPAAEPEVDPSPPQSISSPVSEQKPVAAKVEDAPKTPDPSGAARGAPAFSPAATSTPKLTPAPGKGLKKVWEEIPTVNTDKERPECARIWVHRRVSPSSLSLFLSVSAQLQSFLYLPSCGLRAIERGDLDPLSLYNR